MVPCGMLFDPAIGKYIQDILKEFSENPTSNTFDNIINSKLCRNKTVFLAKNFHLVPNYT